MKLTEKKIALLQALQGKPQKLQKIIVSPGDIDLNLWSNEQLRGFIEIRQLLDEKIIDEAEALNRLKGLFPNYR